MQEKTVEQLVRSPHISMFSQHGTIYIYHDLFGYLLSMSPDVSTFLEYFRNEPCTEDAAASAFSGRFDREQVDMFLTSFKQNSCLIEPGFSEREQLWNLFPVKARWVVGYQPSAAELTFYRTIGSRETQAETVAPWAARLWAAIDGERTLQELAESLLSNDPELATLPNARQMLLETAASWVHHERQYLRFSKWPVSMYYVEAKWPSYLRSTMPFAPWDPRKDPPPPDPLDALATPIAPHDYYKGEIEDVTRQFDEVETTLSHLFRRPNPILSGATFSERIVQYLRQRDLLNTFTESIVEVGAGTGHFAAGFLDALSSKYPEMFERVSYTIIELSPALREAQQKRIRDRGFEHKVEWRAVNIEDLIGDMSLRKSVDLLLCNEVIGDLTTIKLTRELLDLDHAGPLNQIYASWSPETRQRLGTYGELIREYELPLLDAPESFFVNVGAIQFVAWVCKVLRPGGGAYITEYGEQYHYPRASTHLDHIEFSIHYNPLMHVVQREGLDVELAYLQDVLDVDRDACTLATTRSYYASLRTMLASFGIELEKIAYTQEMFEELLASRVALDDLFDIRFEIFDERCMGLAPHEFKALVITT